MPKEHNGSYIYMHLCKRKYKFLLHGVCITCFSPFKSNSLHEDKEPGVFRFFAEIVGFLINWQLGKKGPLDHQMELWNFRNKN